MEFAANGAAHITAVAVTRFGEVGNPPLWTMEFVLLFMLAGAKNFRCGFHVFLSVFNTIK